MNSGEGMKRRLRIRGIGGNFIGGNPTGDCLLWGGDITKVREGGRREGRKKRVGGGGSIEFCFDMTFSSGGGYCCCCGYGCVED